MSFLLLGIDSLIVCAAIGALVASRARLPFVLLFGVADGVGFLVGAGLGWRISESVSTELQTAILVAMGLYLIVVAAGTRRIASWSIWVVPWALTLDNLAFGAVNDNSTGLFSQAAQQGVSSVLMALIGIAVAVAIPRLVPAMERRVAATYRLAGGALVLAAGGLVLLG